jgi:hypothetical protein
MRQGDSGMRKGYTLCVCMQFLGVDKYPVHIEDNGLYSRHGLYPNHFVQ